MKIFGYFGKLLALVAAVSILSNPAYPQQCTLPSNIFLPQPDQDRYESFGASISVDGNYMVAGLSQNSSLHAKGGIAFVYKLDNANQWIKIAELTPSDHARYTNFGRRVAISADVIMISGSDYTDEGDGRVKLYVFEKPAAGEWTSSNENYIIAKPRVDGARAVSMNEFALRGGDLVARTMGIGFEELEIYRRTAGVFELQQAITLPGGSPFIDWNIDLGDGFFALGSDQYQNVDRSSGAVFVYQKDAGLYRTTPALLKASEQSQSDWRAFGLNITIHNTTLVVQGLKYDGSKYSQQIYIAERPQDGWVDSSYPAILEHSGYVYSSIQIAANDNYIFAAGENHNSIIGFRKPLEGWNSRAAKFIIDDPSNSDFTFGFQIQMTDKHLVIGCPNRLTSDSREAEVILDIYRENGDWENALASEATELTSMSINATDDFFGERLTVHNGHLAVTASGDDERGWSSGVVYLFDAENQDAQPYQKIYSPEHEDGTGFGARMAMGDSIMFICAPYKDSISSDGTIAFQSIGKVYVYRQNKSGLWTYSSQIVGERIYPSMNFGMNVVTTRGYCAISEFNGGNSENAGRIHIYKENGANGKFEFLVTLGVSTYGIGHSMTMTDSLLVVGTSGSPKPLSRSSVYVFRKNGEWTSSEYARLINDQPGWRDGFGTSVSISQDHIVVGAPRWPGFDNRPIPRDYLISGAAFIYKMPSNGWRGDVHPVATLTPRDPTEFGAFGEKVVIDHNDIFIGSPNVYFQYNYSYNFTNNDGALLPGKVYHFTRPIEGWTSTNEETRQIQSFEPDVIDGYGSELYISDRYLFVGAPLDDTPSGIRTGSVQTMMQLPAIDELNTVCIDEAPRKLRGFPKGGEFSGPGVNTATSMFSPALAGAGTHQIRYIRDGCEAFMEVVVLANVLLPTRQSPQTQTKCIGKSIPIAFESNVPAENYTWYYRRTGNEAFVEFASTKQIIHVDQEGFYQLVVNRGACSPRYINFEIVEDEEVLIDIEPEPAICSEEEVLLSFTPDNGHWSGLGISAEGVFSPAEVMDGLYKQIYTVTTPMGCVWRDSITLNVDILRQPVLQYGGEPICGDDAVTLRLDAVDDRSRVTWLKNGAQLPSAGLTLDVLDAAEYFAHVRKGNCELSTARATVPKEVVDIAFDIPVLCRDETVTLDATPQGGQWQGHAVTQAGEFDAGSVPDGTYIVDYHLYTTIGCHWQESVEVVVDKLRQPILDYDGETVCRDQPVTLSLRNIDERSTILWHNDHSRNVADSSRGIVLANAPGKYWATVTKGTCTLSTGDVTLEPRPDRLFVPNIFTPNSDHANDFFQISTDGMNDFHLSVFNRYGKRLYETNNVNFQWSGDGVSSGVYFWRITYQSCAETPEELRGSVSIMR